MYCFVSPLHFLLSDLGLRTCSTHIVSDEVFTTLWGVLPGRLLSCSLVFMQSIHSLIRNISNRILVFSNGITGSYFGDLSRIILTFLLICSKLTVVTDLIYPNGDEVTRSIGVMQAVPVQLWPLLSRSRGVRSQMTNCESYQKQFFMDVVLL